MTIQTASLTSTATALDSGASESVWVRNTGTNKVTLTSGSQVTYLRAGRQVSIPISGATTAKVLTSHGGSGSIQYETQGTRQTGGVAGSSGTVLHTTAELISELNATYVPKLPAVAVTADVTATVGNLYICTPVARTVTDGACTLGGTSVTSATAAFVAGDVSSFIVGSHMAPLNTIIGVTNGTTAVVSVLTAVAQTGRTWTIVKPLNVTLPTGAALDVLAVAKGDATLSTITITAPGGGTINGAASIGLSAPRGVVQLTCNSPGVWTATGAVDSAQVGPMIFRYFPLMRSQDTHVGNLDPQLVGKRPGSGSVSTWEAWHEDTQADILHFNCGPGMVGNNDGAALLGLGCDWQGTGVYLHVRSDGGGGKGLRIGMDENLTWTQAVGIECSNGTGTVAGAKFIQSPSGAAAGPAMVWWAQIAPDSSQKLCVWRKPNTLSAGTDVGFVRAIDGYFFWNAPVNVTADTTSAVPMQVTGLAGHNADLQRWDVSGTGTLAKIDKTGGLTAVSGVFAGAAAVVDVHDTSGTSGQRRYRLANSSGYLAISARADAGTTLRDLLLLQHSTANMGVAGQISFGGGVKVIAVPDATTVPSTNPSGGGVLYSEAGALKWRGSSGTVTTIAPA